jgi:hypothetical protein
VVEAGVRVADDRAPHAGRRDACGHEDGGDEADGDDRAAPPRCPRDHERGGDQCGEARLREREQQPDPRDRDGDGSGVRDPRTCREDEHETRDDRDDEEAPVDRRVVEDRVDAEERRVRVPDDHLRVPEDVARRVLVDADRGERERHRDQLQREEGHPAAIPREACEQDREQTERKVERDDGDRALTEVVRPEQREPRPADERGQRPGDPSELARAAVPAQELDHEHERGRRDHQVQRQQEVRLRVADVHRDPGRDAGERGDCHQPRPAAKDERERNRGNDARDGCGDEDALVARGCEVQREPCGAHGPSHEPGEARRTGPRCDQRR